MRILAIGPHSDDIELGCGGTLARANGMDDIAISYLVFSTGHNNKPTIKAECRKAAYQVELSRFAIHSFSARHLHASRQEILNILVDECREFLPELVIGPSIHDNHQDHSVVAHEMVRAFKTCPVWSYLQPWNATGDNRGTVFIRLDRGHLDRKIKALSMYKSQNSRPYMNSIAVEAQARYNGLIAHCEFAERFEAVRFPI